jgi:alanine racemase
MTTALLDTGAPVGAAEGSAAADLRGAWIDVDLDALAANYRRLTADLRRPGGTAPAIYAILKADAYGHGAVRVARVLEEAGVAALLVALLPEGAALRRAGIEVPVLSLGPAQPAQLPLFTRYRITPVVSSLEQLELWRAWARGQGLVQPLHLKVDTGMTRLGLVPEELPRALDVLRAEPALELQGVLSHLAEAEDLASPRNALQEERFRALLEQLSPPERERVVVHLANSAGALHRPSARFGAVRLGLALYGLDPAGRAPGLTPVMALRARILSLKEVPAGTRLGYGGHYTRSAPGWVAAVPVGYADGYPYALGDRADALVAGRRVPVAGTVSMDWTLLDVTAVGPRLAVGDEAVLLGRQGEEEITAVELAHRAATLPYEVLCRLGLGLPRRYHRRGRVSGEASALTRRGR